MANDLLERLLDAQNRHDLDVFVVCFHDDYRSEQPIHPDRTFIGSGQVRETWSAVFRASLTSKPTVACGKGRGWLLGRVGPARHPCRWHTLGNERRDDLRRAL